MTDFYADFAQFYDQGTKTDVAEKVQLIKKTINRCNPNAKTVLELACGTGNILAALADDYTVVGVDLSENMLAVARQKLPTVELHVEDMTDFKLGKKFDVVICLFDSVNHLLTFKQWQSLFDRANEHLNAGGVFLMDINTKAKLEKFSQFSPFRTELSNGYQISKVTKGQHNKYHWIMDVHTDHHDVIHIDIPEVAFPLEKVEDSLSSRFKRVERFTADGAEANEQALRVYFSCTI